MKSSTSLEHFKTLFNDFDPKIHLGKNWKDILNFWIYIDTLTEDEWGLIESKFSSDEYIDLIEEKCSQVHAFSYEIQFSSWICPRNKYSLSLNAPIYASYELIAHQEILKDGLALKILPLFIEL